MDRHDKIIDILTNNSMEDSVGLIEGLFQVHGICADCTNINDCEIAFRLSADQQNHVACDDFKQKDKTDE